tara:strand:+ start:1822 stop:2697 length:876 start_codon:yes stop_codon:yes gene_type:complete
MKYRLLFGLIIFTQSCIFAQSNKYNQIISSNSHDDQHMLHYSKFPNRVLDYSYVRPDDILWYKTYTQSINLKLKHNKVLFFPEDSAGVRYGSGNRYKNLYRLLEAAARVGDISVYKPGKFDIKMTKEEVSAALTEEVKGKYRDPETYEMIDTTYIETLSYKDLKEFLIVEDRFFDKKRGVIDVRINYICPVFETRNAETDLLEAKQIFWVWYPDARQLLANNYTFNPLNTSQTITFDEYFQKRLFAGVIKKESNMYDRAIVDYKEVGMHQLLEADQIKQDIRSFESDLWEY